MKPKDFVIQLRAMMEQHIIMLKNSNEILKTNLELMKENDELKKKIKNGC